MIIGPPLAEELAHLFERSLPFLSFVNVAGLHVFLLIDLWSNDEPCEGDYPEPIQPPRCFMALLPIFDTPASVRDAPAGSPFYGAWSSFIATRLSAVRPGDNGGAFYDPTETDVNIAAAKTLTWIGFPRDVLLPGNRDNKPAAYAFADSDVAFRDPQNEYFEWYVTRNAAGKIRKLTFVTETPEYYQTLWNTNPNLVLTLYQTLVSPAVTLADLQSGTAYNKFNRWNTTDGIVHYIQSINTLAAALGLAQGSVTAPPPFPDNFEARPGSGTARTAVDPRVGFDVHMLVRKGLHITFRDPVGLYIVEWNDSGFSKPDGTPVGNYWRIVRGSPGMVLRLEYEVPAAAGFVVGDIRIGGHRIEYGGQVAEHITVSTSGTAGTPA
jgi:hypothetical protein